MATSRFGVADASELSVLGRTFDEYCAKHGISRDDDRERIALRVLRLFGRGFCDPIRLSDELERTSWLASPHSRKRERLP